MPDGLFVMFFISAIGSIIAALVAIRKNKSAINFKKGSEHIHRATCKFGRPGLSSGLCFFALIAAHNPLEICPVWFFGAFLHLP